MNQSSSIERRVGIFVFFGLLVTAFLILYFGKVGDRFRGGIPITVEFSNAGGLVSGAQVLYAGVLVGKVDHIELKKDGKGVAVEVNLFESGKIRKDARFLIKQSGLLGDQHIVVVPISDTAPPLIAGDVIKGTDPFDFSDIASQAGEAIKKLNEAINKLSSEVLKPDTLDHIKIAIKNFSELTGKLNSNSQRLDQILASLRKGNGTLGRLLTDASLFEEFKRLVHNWRVYGLLHREKSEERYPNPRKNPSSKSDDP